MTRERFKIGNVRFRFLGTGYKGRLVASKYDSGCNRVDVEVRNVHNRWEAYAELSVDYGDDYELPKKTFLVRNWGANEGLAEVLEGDILILHKKVWLGYKDFNLNPASWRRASEKTSDHTV